MTARLTFLARLVLAVIALAASVAKADTIDLSGGGRFIFGDDPAFAAPDFDDADWGETSRTATPDWADLGATPGPQVKWERLRFQASKSDALSRAALYMGVVAGADTVFLNGVKIGETNNLASGYNTWRVRTNRLYPRLYPVPPDLLFHDRENVLAIRFARFALDPSGVAAPPIQIADQEVVTALRDARAARFLAFSAIQLSMNLLVVLVVLTGVMFGLRSPSLFWLLLTTSMFLPSATLSSTILVNLGIAAHPLVHIYAIKLAALAVAPMLSFAAAALERSVGIVGRCLQVVQVGLFLTPPDLVELLGDDHWIVVAVWALSATLSLALVAFWALKAVLNGRLSSFPLLIGLIALTGGLAMDGAGQNQVFALATGAPAVEMMVTVFQLCLLVMGGLAHLETSHRLAAAQSSILGAHEAERRRFAYDVHDGIGQWLTTIKLNLQMLRSEQRGTSAEEGLGDVVDQIDEAISDARRIAHDLSPALIEREGLAAAMRSHADMIARRANIEIIVEASDPPSIAPERQSHLFRVFQEALQNAIRHSGADEISVSLATEGPVGRLIIRDNGQGFAAGDDRGGLGLASIRERAMLLGGRCRVESGPSGGVTVEVTFAVKDRR